jgi:uncharacterized protein (DUF58 family)
VTAHAPPDRVLPPELVARIGRLRLALRRRVHGRFAGGHASRRFGSSTDFADYRSYAPGDDPRRVDWHAHARLGRLLVKQFEAEDEAALRVVVDLSASMGFGGKARLARELAAALVAIASAGGDRARVLLVADEEVDAGPWLRGPSALPVAERRLLGRQPGGSADLVAALRRAHAEGPAGPVVLVSDLLFDGWESAVETLAAGRGDPLLVHVLATSDLQPDVEGDLRLTDAETGEERDVAADRAALGRYRARRDAWLAAVAEACGRRGVGLARLVDDEELEPLLSGPLVRLGLVS